MSNNQEPELSVEIEMSGAETTMSNKNKEEDKTMHTKTKRNLGVDDFGYSFVGYAPPSAADEPETTTTTPSTEETAFIYRPPAKNLDHGLEKGRNDPIIAWFSVAGCACVLTVTCAISGAVLAVIGSHKEEDNDYKKKSDYALLGGILLAVAACTCLCCVLSVCFACCTACLVVDDSKFGGKGDGRDDRVKIKLRRLNDRFYHDYQSNELNKVRLNVVSSIRVFQTASAKEKAQKKKEQDLHKKQLEEHVKRDLEAGMSPSDIAPKYRPVAFLIDFHGDMMVNSMELLRKQVSFIVHTAKPEVDRAIVVLTSPGGSVAHYGLAASQLVRIRKAGIHLTVCIDTVAASGGFMMATVANDIYAAPFAIVGSIGVVTQIPNFQRFLEKRDIDAYLFTSGKYKRTIDLIGEVTQEGKEKLQQQLDDIHGAFKDHVSLSRPKLSQNVEDVATGEHWLAVQAKELGLIDHIMTSDELLDHLVKDKQYDVIEIIQKKDRLAFISQFGASILTFLKGGNIAEQVHQQNTYNPMVVS